MAEKCPNCSTDAPCMCGFIMAAPDQVGGVSIEYQMIQEYYHDRRAERSGLPYIKHIDDGIEIIRARLSSSDLLERTVRAFCIHPLVQDNYSLRKHLDLLQHLEGDVVALAVEYRAVANAYLSKDYKGPDDAVPISCLREVNEMLIADKVQNYRDLINHNREHPRYRKLRNYFENWFKALLSFDEVVVLAMEATALEVDRLYEEIGGEDLRDL